VFVCVYAKFDYNLVRLQYYFSVLLTLRLEFWKLNMYSITTILEKVSIISIAVYRKHKLLVLLLYLLIIPRSINIHLAHARNLQLAFAWVKSRLVEPLPIWASAQHTLRAPELWELSWAGRDKRIKHQHLCMHIAEVCAAKKRSVDPFLPHRTAAAEP
jgi:hypothetical protein